VSKCVDHFWIKVSFMYFYLITFLHIFVAANWTSVRESRRLKRYSQILEFYWHYVRLDNGDQIFEPLFNLGSLCNVFQVL
jgi:hypothetical protein